MEIKQERLQMIFKRNPIDDDVILRLRAFAERGRDAFTGKKRIQLSDDAERA